MGGGLARVVKRTLDLVAICCATARHEDCWACVRLRRSSDRNGIVDRTVARAKWGIQLRHLYSGRGVEALVSVSARRRGEVRPARISGLSAARCAVHWGHLLDARAATSAAPSVSE